MGWTVVAYKLARSKPMAEWVALISAFVAATAAVIAYSQAISAKRQADTSEAASTAAKEQAKSAERSAKLAERNADTDQLRMLLSTNERLRQAFGALGVLKEAYVAREDAPSIEAIRRVFAEATKPLELNPLVLAGDFDDRLAATLTEMKIMANQILQQSKGMSPEVMSDAGLDAWLNDIATEQNRLVTTLEAAIEATRQRIRQS